MVEDLNNRVAQLHAEKIIKDVRIEILEETIEELKTKKRKFSLKNLLKWQ